MKNAVDHRRATSSLGEVIRRSRQGRYTVEELAGRAGISPSLITQIEHGRGNPSFLTLQKLGQALGLPMAAFFDDETDYKARMIVRKAKRRKLLLEPNLIYELITPDFDHTIGFLQWEIPPGWHNREKPFTHRGEECAFVASGSIEGHVGEEDFVLQKGDAATYDSVLPHWWRNTTRRRATLYLLCSPPMK
jgi:transcriptional regulator with XRE-family HTH domain